VLRSFSAIMANTPYIQFFLTDVQVDVAGETGVVTCAENILTEVTEAGSSGSVVATNVFVRRPDGWRLRVHHGSPVMGTLEETDE
jgi:ketosteroid isomerase-like protein